MRDQNILGIRVSIDGTWKKRGFSSLNRGVAAISIDNGKIIAVEAISRYCRECFVNTLLLQNDKDMLQVGKQEHSNTCKLSYDCSALSMESSNLYKIN